MEPRAIGHADKYAPTRGSECPHAPSFEKQHHWKFGKCSYCQQPEPESAWRPNSQAVGGLDAIKKAFRRFDTDGSGTIILSELKALLQMLPVAGREGGAGWTDAEANQLLNMIDENHDGVIDYHEFTDWIHHDGDGAADIMKKMKARSSLAPRRSGGGRRPSSRGVSPRPSGDDKAGEAGPERLNPAAEAPAVETPAAETPAAEAPAAEAPAVEAPAAETPAAEAPAAEAPANEAPANEAPATEAPAAEAQFPVCIPSMPEVPAA